MTPGAAPMEVALRLLGAREHSREELRRKLLARGGSDEVIAPVLDRLGELGYLDDRRFSRLYVDARGRRGVGRNRLVEELVARGVDRTLAAEAVGAAALEGEHVRAVDLARQRARLGRGREQVGRFLLRRGFPAPEVRSALETVFDRPDA